MKESESSVVDLDSRKRNLKGWQFSLDIFKKGNKWEADITGFEKDGLEVGDRLRMFADALEEISFMMRQEAEKFKASDKGDAVCVVTVFRDSTVRVRLKDEDFTEPHQQDWLKNRLDDAKEASFS